MRRVCDRCVPDDEDANIRLREGVNILGQVVKCWGQEFRCIHCGVYQFRRIGEILHANV